MSEGKKIHPASKNTFFLGIDQEYKPLDSAPAFTFLSGVFRHFPARQSQDVTAIRLQLNQKERITIASEAISANKKDMDSSLQKVLSPSEYARLLEYDDHIGEYALIAQLEQALYADGAVTLTRDQIKSIESHMSQLRTPAPNSFHGLIAIGSDQMAPLVRGGYHCVLISANSMYINNTGTIYSNLVVSPQIRRAVSNVLTQPQLNAFQSILSVQEQMRSLAEHFHL